MSIAFDELEKQARALSLKEKAMLARLLIEELDMSVDANAEQLWIDEARARHNAFLKGELEALLGDEVMDRARTRYLSRKMDGSGKRLSMVKLIGEPR